MKARFSRRASADLRDIVREIATANPRAARQIRENITRAAARIAENPMLGPHVGPGTLRRIVLSPYLVFYQAASDAVTVVRVLHGARDLDPLLRDGRDGEPGT